MKPVLITRCTADVTDPLSDVYGDRLLMNALEHAGIPYERRLVTPGEDLSGYAGVLASMVKLNSLNAFTHRYGLLWAVSQLPAIVVPEDWQLLAWYNSLVPRYIWDYPTKTMLKGSIVVMRDRSLPYAPILDDATTRIHDGKVLTLLKLYDWGLTARIKSGGMFTTGRVNRLDLSAFTPEYHRADVPVDLTQKRRQWVLAQLADPRSTPRGQRYRESFDSQPWPVLGFHGTMHDRSRGWKQPERVIVDTYYRQSWGVMATPYDHAGSGWWRLRFHQAVAMRCLICAMPDELGALGGAFTFKPNDIVHYSDTELSALADAQRDAFITALRPKDEAAAELVAMMMTEGFAL